MIKNHFHSRVYRLFTSLTALSLTAGIPLIASVAQALSFNFTPTFDTTTAQGQAAFNGFVEAGNLWSSFLRDPITINYTIGFQSLSPGVLAQASSQSAVFRYNQIATALRIDATSTDDLVATANLPGFNEGGTEIFAFVGTEEDGSLEVDPFTTGVITADNVFLDVNKANAKALGLTIDANGNPVNYNSEDGLIIFSTDFTFDFDRSDGIEANAFDFVGIAAHEIGHGLGFVSGVDIVDALSRPTLAPGASATNLDPFAVFSVLDLFRYSEASVAVGKNLGVPVLDLAVGSSGSFTLNGITYTRSRPYFSIDGGQTNLGTFSTGAFDGDGRQASHWQDNLNLGLMDPTVAPGELLQITALDVRAFDVMGFDTATPVPFEFSPGVGLAFLGGLFGLDYLRKKRKDE